MRSESLDFEKGPSGQQESQHNALRPMTTDDIILLSKGGQTPDSISCTWQINTVSVVVDLVTDQDQIWTEQVHGAHWMRKEEHFLQKMKEAITVAGTISGLSYASCHDFCMSLPLI